MTRAGMAWHMCHSAASVAPCSSASSKAQSPLHPPHLHFIHSFQSPSGFKHPIIHSFFVFLSTNAPQEACGLQYCSPHKNAAFLGSLLPSVFLAKDHDCTIQDQHNKITSCNKNRGPWRLLVLKAGLDHWVQWFLDIRTFFMKTVSM